LKLKAITRKI